MKRPEKKIVKPRNPVAVAARLRTSAGPMKAGKKRLHKKLREENRKSIEEESNQLERIEQFKQFEQFKRFDRLNQFKQSKQKSVKSFKVYKDGKVADEIKGTLQPFTVSGSKELIKIGMECGFGQNNSMGCGYVEAVQAV